MHEDRIQPESVAQAWIQQYRQWDATLPTWTQAGTDWSMLFVPKGLAAQLSRGTVARTPLWFEEPRAKEG